MKNRTWTLGERTLLRFLGAGLLALSFLGSRPAAATESALAALGNCSDDLKALTETVAPNAIVHLIVGSEAPLSPQEQLRI